jgi:hypothetical protein
MIKERLDARDLTTHNVRFTSITSLTTRNGFGVGQPVFQPVHAVPLEPTLPSGSGHRDSPYHIRWSRLWSGAATPNRFERDSDKRRRPDVEQKGQKPAERTAERSNPTRRGRSSQTLGAGSSSRKGGPVASVLQGKGKGRDGTSGAVRPRSSPRSRVSEPPVPIPDLSALPHISKARRVRVPGFDTILLEKPRSADSVSRSSLLDWTLRLPSPPYTANDSQSSTAPSSPFVHVRPTSFPLLQRLPSPRLWLRPGVGS